MWSRLAVHLGAHKVLLGAVGALVLVGLVAWALIASYNRGCDAGKAEVQAAWNDEKRKRQDNFIQLHEDHRKADHAIADAAADAQQEKNNEIARIDADLVRLLDGLRERPKRPAAVPGAPVPPPDGKGPGCDGRGLYAEDGAVLSWEAARAERCVAALTQCYTQYDAARAAVNGVTHVER